MNGIAKYNPHTMVVQVWTRICGSHPCVCILKANVLMSDRLCITDSDDVMRINAVVMQHNLLNIVIGHMIDSCLWL
jgi:hypothetical protein